MVSSIRTAALVATLMGCATLVQSSVRSAGTECSTTRFWIASDVVLAGLSAYAANQADGDAGSYVPAGVFATSALYGVFKRSRCERYIEAHPPVGGVSSPRSDDAPSMGETATTELLRQGARALQRPVPTLRVRETQSSSTSSLTINGHTSVDTSPNSAQGQACSIDHNTCPSGYSCYIVIGDQGTCVRP
jgi:hypothetical protein